MHSVSVPSFRKIKEHSEYTVYEIRVTKPGGNEVVLEKRFREFYEFNKQISKVIEPLHFPSKKLPKPLNTSSRFLEWRREALEHYLRNLMQLIGNSEVHDHLSQFLDTKLTQQNLDTTRTSSTEELDGDEDEGPRITHQPVICFTRDPFQEDCDSSSLPDIVLQGAMDALLG